MASLMTMPDGMHPFWAMYVGAPELDTLAAQITQLGGGELSPVNDVPTVGHMQMMRDAFRDVLAGEGTWVPLPVPGVRVKLLSRDAERGYVVFLAEEAPRTEFPAHDHSGPEECFVLQGEVTINGRTLHPGDSIHAPAMTTPAPIFTETGCLVLFDTDERDYIG